jgi:hypothetical protein
MEKGQRLVGSESRSCVRVERHVNPWTVVSVTWQYKNPAKRIDLVQI